MHSFTTDEFGILPDATRVTRVTMNNGTVSVSILDYGATLQSVKMRGIDGEMKELTLNYDCITGILEHPGYFFGATVGRFANRIANGEYTLDGKQYSAFVNNGKNSLHGGKISWGHKMWMFEKKEVENGIYVEMTIVSPDGDENYPGEVTMHVRFLLTDDNELQLEYHGTTTKKTIINMTNHTYWNMSGNLKECIYNQILCIPAERYLPVVDMIPTGELAPVESTPFDFREGKPCSQAMIELGGGKPGLDHCYCFGESGTMKFVGSLADMDSKYKLEVFTTEPGMQVYMGNWIFDEYPYIQHNAVALECQHYPDSPNQPHFPTTQLCPDEEYYQKTVFKFSLLE